LAEAFAVDGLALGLEKSPAAAIPLVLILSTQYSIDGTTLPAAAKSNCSVWLVAVTTSWCAFPGALIAWLDRTPTTALSRAAVPETSNCACPSKVRTSLTGCLSRNGQDGAATPMIQERLAFCARMIARPLSNLAAAVQWENADDKSVARVGGWVCLRRVQRNEFRRRSVRHHPRRKMAGRRLYDRQRR
jgi:hypothetical protein